MGTPRARRSSTSVPETIPEMVGRSCVVTEASVDLGYRDGGSDSKYATR
jgi:hypothetical protein